MARFLLSVHLDDDLTPMTAERQAQAHADTGVLNRRMQQLGVLILAGGLVPTDEAFVVDATSSPIRELAQAYVTGPRRLGGFWIIDVSDAAAAREWAREASAACNEPVEVRAFRGGS